MSNDISMQYSGDQVYNYTVNKYCWHHILVLRLNFTQYDTILDCADGVAHNSSVARVGAPEEHKTKEIYIARFHRSSVIG